ncbi:MAG: DUF4176 domain-containing protein [Butyrivibrio sp.]|jgi:hypothetical protein|nr:DUF4176 domain-containing protein [Butyrivibrio sp.]
MLEKMMPIGSVVRVDGIGSRVLICGHQQMKKGDEGHIYDYIGVSFPSGYTGSDEMILFDHSSILLIYFIGLRNQEQIEYMNAMAEALKAIN